MSDRLVEKFCSVNPYLCILEALIPPRKLFRFKLRRKLEPRQPVIRFCDELDNEEDHRLCFCFG
jgi:hypothetical protein